MTLLPSETIYVLGTCIESNNLVNKLKGTSSTYVNGWMMAYCLDLVTKTDDQHGFYYGCEALGGPKDFWAGCCDPTRCPPAGAAITTALNGCGHAKLNVGNCWPSWRSDRYRRPDYYHVQVYLDGKVIGEVPRATNSKIFEFAFKEKSVLKIDPKGGIIKFNNFEVTDCNC